MLRHYNRHFDSHASVEMAVGFYSHLKEADSAKQLQMDEEAVFRCQSRFAGEARMPDTAHLAKFQAVMRESAPQTLADNMDRKRVATMDWTAPPYAEALVFNPNILREYKEKDYIHWRDYLGESNCPFARTLLKHWDQHCALWETLAAVARFPNDNSDEGERAFWNNLAPFIESHSAAKQQLLSWLRQQPLKWRDDSLLQCLANIAPKSILFLDGCFQLLGNGSQTHAATLLGRHSKGDEQVLHRLTHDHEGQPKKNYWGGEIIAL